MNNRIWLARTKNVAVISAEDAINFGLTGPVLRGSGVAYDVRKLEPYGAYDKVDWEVPSARTAIRTIAIGSGWKKCGRAPGSSSNVWIRCPAGRSWPMCRK